MGNLTPAFVTMGKLLRGHFVRVRKFSFRFCVAVRRKQVPSHRCPFLIDHAEYDADFFEATSINYVAGLTVEPEQHLVCHENFLSGESHSVDRMLGPGGGDVTEHTDGANPGVEKAIGQAGAAQSPRVCAARFRPEARPILNCRQHTVRNVARFGIFSGPNNRLMMGAVPRERSGSAGGIIATARTLGQTMGAALVAFWRE